MLKELRESYVETIEAFSLYYQTHNSGGYSFPSDKDGNVLELPTEAVSNYRRCLSGEVITIRPPYVRDDSWTYRHPRLCECECGQELSMDCDNEGLVYCHCGRCYNSAGQSIRPRSEWEERYDDDY